MTSILSGACVWLAQHPKPWRVGCVGSTCKRGFDPQLLACSEVTDITLGGPAGSAPVCAWPRAAAFLLDHVKVPREKVGWACRAVGGLILSWVWLATGTI